jgi:hypothetical protein
MKSLKYQTLPTSCPCNNKNILCPKNGIPCLDLITEGCSIENGYCHDSILRIDWPQRTLIGSHFAVDANDLPRELFTLL